jgi:hypothetical protein
VTKLASGGRAGVVFGRARCPGGATVEDIIAIGVGVIVGGGILTLVWRILTAGREEKRLQEELSQFAKPAEESGKASKKKKGKK